MIKMPFTPALGLVAPGVNSFWHTPRRGGRTRPDPTAGACATPVIATKSPGARLPLASSQTRLSPPVSRLPYKRRSEFATPSVGIVDSQLAT